MNYFSEVALMAAELQAGESRRFICPACLGGSTSEASLSVINLGQGYLFQCFRSKCGISGGRGKSALKKGDIIRPKRKAWNGKLMPIPQKISEWIHKSWGIYPPPATWYWTRDYGGRIAMSIRSPNGSHRGWVLRATTPGSAKTSKAITFLNEGGMGLCWLSTRTRGPTVVVEDLPSAHRASKYVNAVALCGTDLGDDKAAEIREFATKPIILALDNDATNKSFAIAKRYALMWDNVRCLPLGKDIKDMDEEALEDLLRDNKNERKARTIERNSGEKGV